MSIIGLQRAKGQPIRRRVVKEEDHSGIAKTTLTIVKKNHALFFHSPSADLKHLCPRNGKSNQYERDTEQHIRRSQDTDSVLQSFCSFVKRAAFNEGATFDRLVWQFSLRLLPNNLRQSCSVRQDPVSANPVISSISARPEQFTQPTDITSEV
jgi:hypothetical protein